VVTTIPTNNRADQHHNTCIHSRLFDCDTPRPRLTQHRQTQAVVTSISTNSTTTDAFVSGSLTEIRLIPNLGQPLHTFMQVA
jgi:hypothetical protein